MNSLKLLLIALMMTSLTACSATEISSEPTLCPVPVAYSRAFQVRMADELATLPGDSAVREAMKDYKVLRDQVRACQ